MSLITNGSNQYLQTPITGVRRYPFTAAVWVWHTGGSGFPLGFGATGTDIGNFTVQIAGSLLLLRVEGVSAPMVTYPLNNNAWNHVAIVCTSATSRRLDINGATAITDTTSAALPSSPILQLGARFQSSPSNYYSGKFAHASVYGRALTLAQVQSLHGLADPASVPGLIHRLRLTADLADSWGDGFTATAFNSPTVDADGPAIAAWPPSGGSTIQAHRLKLEM